MDERPPPVQTETVWQPWRGATRYRRAATTEDGWYAQGVFSTWPAPPYTVYLAYCGQPFDFGAASAAEAYHRIASFVRLAIHLYQRGIVPPAAWLQAYDNIGAWPRWSLLDDVGFYEDAARRQRRHQGFRTSHRLATRS